VDLILRIGSDPSSWVVPNAEYGQLVDRLSQATAPVVLDVVAPLAGRLVLSHRAAGSVVLLQPPGGQAWESTDWNPSRIAKPVAPVARVAPVVYIASPGGPGQGTSQYALSSSVTSQVLEQEIVTAMSGDGTELTLPVFDPTGTGVLLLHGAALPFAVIF
jgi:hypothetical protein